MRLRTANKRRLRRLLSWEWSHKAFTRRRTSKVWGVSNTSYVRWDGASADEVWAGLIESVHHGYKHSDVFNRSYARWDGPIQGGAWAYVASSPAVEPLLRMDFTQRLIQDRNSATEMETMRRIAVECGATVGEGAMYDSISFDTLEQMEAFTERLAKEQGCHD